MALSLEEGLGRLSARRQMEIGSQWGDNCKIWHIPSQDLFLLLLVKRYCSTSTFALPEWGFEKVFSENAWDKRGLHVVQYTTVEFGKVVVLSQTRDINHCYAVCIILIRLTYEILKYDASLGFSIARQPWLLINELQGYHVASLAEFHKKGAPTDELLPVFTFHKVDFTNET